MDGRQRRAALPAHRAAGRGRGLSSEATAQLRGLVDSHCHLQDVAFDADREAVLERAAAAGVEQLLVPGFDLPSSRGAMALAAAYPQVRAAVGVHPHFAGSTTAAEWDELAQLAAEPDVVAVGEIGLDYFRNLSPPAVQREAFARQLALATELNKPVLVHDREAHEDIRTALLDWSGPGRPTRGVLHAFSGDEPMARELTSAGFLVSFALPITFKSATGPRATAAAVERGAFLTETDSPWLAPQGREARNEPTTVLRVASELARLRDEPPQVVATGVAGAFARLIGA
ncbi:MAG TPA: TatD family hydrolase [Candidatus Limnocylindria bacterium]